MTKTAPAPLTTAQAVDRARQLIESGRKLSDAAKEVSAARGGTERAVAEAFKETKLLSYRIGTVPDALEPVLEVLIRAASDRAHTA